jgi:hypothetical protein
MTFTTLQVTEVQFDFDDDDFTPEQQQEVIDSVLGGTFEFQFDFDDVDEETVAMALVEEVTDYTGWCVCSLDYRQVQ